MAPVCMRSCRALSSRRLNAWGQKLHANRRAPICRQHRRWYTLSSSCSARRAGTAAAVEACDDDATQKQADFTGTRPAPMPHAHVCPRASPASASAGRGSRKTWGQRAGEQRGRWAIGTKTAPGQQGHGQTQRNLMERWPKGGKRSPPKQHVAMQGGEAWRVQTTRAAVRSRAQGWGG